ncbi:MAG: porin family protein [Saprospiraceae bacterium]
MESETIINRALPKSQKSRADFLTNYLSIMYSIIRLFIVVNLVTLSQQILAQSLRLKGGLNISEMRQEDNEEYYSASSSYKSLMGFNFGATAEFPIKPWFSIESGLLLSSKGFKIDYHFDLLGDSIDLDAKLNPIYLEIPVEAIFRRQFKHVNLIAGLGPFLAIGIDGQIKSVLKVNDEIDTVSDKIRWGSDEANDQFRRLDLGLVFRLGLEVEAFQLNCSYDFGLANVSSSRENDLRVNSRTLSLSIAYKLADFDKIRAKNLVE